MVVGSGTDLAAESRRCSSLRPESAEMPAGKAMRPRTGSTDRAIKLVDRWPASRRSVRLAGRRSSPVSRRNVADVADHDLVEGNHGSVDSDLKNRVIAKVHRSRKRLDIHLSLTQSFEFVVERTPPEVGRGHWSHPQDAGLGLSLRTVEQRSAKCRADQMCAVRRRDSPLLWHHSDELAPFCFRRLGPIRKSSRRHKKMPRFRMFVICRVPD